MNIKINDMSWPYPADGLEWRMRYLREVSLSDRMSAASIIAAYVQMIKDPVKKRQMVISEIRKALKEGMK